MKRITAIFGLVALLAAGIPGSQDSAWADQVYRVTFTNITKGQVVTPPVLVNHNRNFRLFTLGEPASDELAMLAEDGATDALVDLLMGNPNVHDFAVADAGLMPGESVTLEIEVGDHFPGLSAAGMLATTNDGFFGMNSQRGFSLMRQFTVYANAYDAGSEANNESCEFIPGPPCENPFVRMPQGAEGFVHVHSGIHGIGDLSPAELDWQNPVVKIVIARQQ
jgi:hypothetical protein